MSGVTTMSGGATPLNFSSTAGGSPSAFGNAFGSGTSYTGISGSGAVSVSGAAVINSSNTALTISGASGITDNSAGNNSITLATTTKFFSQAGDTISASSGATTMYGANFGQTTFTSTGALNSIVGGNGNIQGTSTGANSLLTGGQGISLFTVTGANSVVVAGAKGVTGVDLSKSTGPEAFFTNPGSTSGLSVVYMGSGADSFIGGAGTNIVRAGSGPDTFAFLNGHAGGTTYILGFNSNDQVIGNYNGISSETITSGSDVITLSDNTKIVLVNYDHKIF